MKFPPQMFPYMERDARLGVASLAPILPLTLIAKKSVDTAGLLDSGAAVNVLPYSIGLQLGFDWDLQTRTVELTGNLAAAEGRVIVVSAVVGNFPPVRMAFAWARTESVGVILGQVNFFLEFDVCFFRSRGLFEVRPKSNGKGDAGATA